jgi:hypothetical protein
VIRACDNLQGIFLGSFIKETTGRVWVHLKSNESFTRVGNNQNVLAFHPAQHVIIGFFDATVKEDINKVMTEGTFANRIHYITLPTPPEWLNIHTSLDTRRQMENYVVLHALGFLVGSFHVKDNNLTSPIFAMNRVEQLKEMVPELAEMAGYYCLKMIETIME